jgi:2-oxoisovalerate dehydrogenase E2 component (dihydrolipoyl transacylase)
MSRFEFKLPDIGEGIAEAELVEWLVNVGDEVKEDQVVAAVMTDKATVELEAPCAGQIVEREADVGDVIRVGSVLMVFETADSGLVASEQAVEERPTEAVSNQAPPQAEKMPSPPPSPPPSLPPSSRKVLASPLARRRARDLGVDLSLVPHEGPRVLNSDLDAYILPGKTPDGTGIGHASPATLEDQDIPLTGMRRIIAQKMAESKRNIPHFSYVEEIDMTEIERLRAELNSGERGQKLTILPLLIAAICRTLPQFPQLNAHYYDDTHTLRRFGAVHMGIAAQTDAGLMVPVIHDANAKSIDELADLVAARAEQARKGTIKREELRGSTITVSSLGKLGGIAATPILNRPEVCIIGPNKIATRPVWQDNQFVPRKMMNLSISCDHRVVDGYDAAAFVQALKRRLEAPALIFVDG